MSIDEILETLTRVDNIEMAAMCDYDGIVIAAQAAIGTLTDEQFAAWAAEMGRAALGVTQNWNGGDLRLAVFEASMGLLILANVGKGYLVVASDPTANAGLLRLETERAAEALRRVLGTAPTETAGDAPSQRTASA
ncbi:MAG: roadblock/LC7 domain-containing protein [Candidatus Zipacnadales bacterium]